MTPNSDFIRFRCSRCTHALKISAQYAGKKVYCPACYQELTVPAESEPDRRSAAAEQMYGVDTAPRDTRDMADRYAFAEVVCPLCATKVAVQKDSLPTVVECPDCGTKIKVTKEKLQKQNDYLALMRAQQPGFSENTAEKKSANAEDIYGIGSADAPVVNDPTRLSGRLIPVTCPVCQTLLYANESQIGKKIRCPDCETLVTVPNRSPENTPLPPGTRDYNGGDVYGITPQDRSLLTEVDRQNDDAASAQYGSASQAKTDLIPVRCRQCGTLLYAERSKIGKSLICPDCGVQNRITAPTAEQTLNQQRIEPVFTGGYNVSGPVPKGPSQAADDSFQQFADQVAQSIQRPETAPSPFDRRSAVPPLQTTVRQAATPPPVPSRPVEKPRSPEEQTLASLADLEKQVQASTPAVQVRAKKKKSRRRKAGSDEFNGLVPVINDRGDVVLTIPSPPKATMGLNVFHPIFRADYWAHWLFFQIVLIPLTALLYFMILPLLTGDQPQNPFTEFRLLLAIIAAIGLAACGLWQGSQNITSVFSILSGGGREVREWMNEPISDGLLSGLRYGAILFLALVPAGICTTLARLGIVPIPAQILWLAVIGGIYFLFPVIFLSTMQSDLPILPISGLVLRSFSERFGTWLGYYFWTGIFFAVPACALVLFPAGLIQGIGIILLMIFTLPIAVPLLGRLGWVLTDFSSED